MTGDLMGQDLSGPAVEDYTRPLLPGYVRRELLVTDDEVDDVRSELSRFAAAKGFTMGHTYVEQLGGWPAAFEALIEVVNRYDVTAVILPSLLHFAVLGVPADFKNTFEQATGARVLVARSYP